MGLWDCVPRVVVGGDGCAGGGVPLGGVPVLSWCGEVSLGGRSITIILFLFSDARRWAGRPIITVEFLVKLLFRCAM